MQGALCSNQPPNPSIERTHNGGARLLASSSTAAPDPATVPDLVALPAYGIVTSHEHGRDYLQFGADVWNRGPASLVVEGFRVPDEDRMDAYQYFAEDGVKEEGSA